MGTEKIVNGEFETGDFTGWGYSGTTPTISSAEHHSGSHSAKIDSLSTNLNQTLNVLHSNISSFGFYYKTTLYGFVYYRITFSDSSTVSKSIGVVTAWTYVDVLSAISGKSPTLYVTKIEIYSCTDTTYIDDVSLIEIASTTRTKTYSLDVLIEKINLTCGLGLDAYLWKPLYCQKCKIRLAYYHIQNSDFSHFEWLCLICYNLETNNGRFTPYPN